MSLSDVRGFRLRLWQQGAVGWVVAAGAGCRVPEGRVEDAVGEGG